MEELFLGVDVGSISANTVLMDQEGKVLEEHYDRVKGQPLRVVKERIADILSRVEVERIRGIAFTGKGAKLLSELFEAPFYNEVIAQSEAITKLYPQVRTIIDIGGQDSKFILLEEEGGRLRIRDFGMNTLCAAGTGSFLDQQASRLKLTIEEFSRLALKSENPPRIAGRCSVFAKSDMIHLQQIATPDYDIVAGLCYALARNFKGNIAKGAHLKPVVAFIGGVAANLGMRKALKEVLELEDEEFLVPEHFASMGAIGAVLLALKENKFNGFKGLSGLEEYLKTLKYEPASWEPLTLRPEHLENKSKIYIPKVPPLKKIPAYLGIDVGSISTNLVVIDSEGRVLAKRYLMTAGRPIEAIRQGLKEIGDEIGHLVDIQGVGTTGSGRYLTGDFVGADVVRNEITAQATAAIHIDPQVDTIFEIGGQDSKYIRVDRGVIVDFEMNKVCAAGTGSFLEEQAERLGLDIKSDFQELALKAKNPVKMGERCTVFIESDLVHHQQQGARIDDLVAGLCYSIALNYLNRVVGDRKIGERIFFQGGTAFNKGVVAAFEKLLGRPITVPENHEVTGAIGAALLAMRERTWEKSNFKGFDLSQRRYEIKTFECKSCPNHCLIRRVTIEGEKEPLFYGSRCEKYDVLRRRRKSEIPNLFKERERLLFMPYPGEEKLPEDAPQIGIPICLYLHEFLPFWRAFFTELGFRVVFSDRTNKELIRQGVEAVVAETCFPIKVAHGHVLNLIQKGLKRIFLPSVVGVPKLKEDFEHSQSCPYAQALPYVIRSAIRFEDYGAQLLSPVVPFGWGEEEVEEYLIDFGKQLGKSPSQVRWALKCAWEFQKRFEQGLKVMGRWALEELFRGEKALVIVGRPYNTCDPEVNLDIPEKLRDLGVLAIPMDFLPLEKALDREGIREMYWRYGQKILLAAHLIREDERLYPVYISNFGCGPDSFIIHFFKEIMGDKPALILEIDEHSADAGIVTRLEAYLDSLKNAPKALPPVIKRGRIGGDVERVIWIPYMCDHAYAFKAAFEACGVRAEVFPESDQETLYWGRKYTSGKECYPCVLTTGDMIKITKRPDFDPKKAAFFMPSGNGPCRFGQYHRFHRKVLDELGLHEVPIYSPNQDETLYRDLGILGAKFTRLGWWAIVGVDLLYKKLLETRPYEVNPGETDRVYWECLWGFCDLIRKDPKIEEVVDFLLKARKRLDDIPTKDKGSKPKIGVVGEIYVRLNRFANEDVIRKIEMLGGEARLAPLVEWVHYINKMAKRRAKRRGHLRNLLGVLLKEYFQKKDERQLAQAFYGSIEEPEEPPTEHLLRLAEPYVHDSFEGEAILTIGKTIDYALKGACGVVNVMPFTCMPGTITTAILKRYREENGHFPVLNIAYDGQEGGDVLVRLEAFMHQVKQYMEKLEKRT
jgi:predicted CoA-substrate-specific enzyme activase